MEVAETVIEPPKPRNRPKFTPEQARLAGLKSVESKRQAKLATLMPVQEASVEPSAKPDPYLNEQRTRIRAHIERIDELIGHALEPRKACKHCGQEGLPDCQDLERLARARTAFEELDRRYSQRSLPPVMRVAEVKTRRLGGLLGELPE